MPAEDRRMLEFVAHLLMQNGKWDQALALYEALLHLQPGEPRLLLATGYLLLNLNRAEEALARLDWLMASRPAEVSDTLALLRARALAAVGRREEAREFLRDPVRAAAEAHGW